MTERTTIDRKAEKAVSSTEPSLASIPLLSLLPYKLGVWLDSPILIRAGRARLWWAGEKWWHRILRVLLILTVIILVISYVTDALVISYVINARGESGRSMIETLIPCEGILCALLIPALAGGAIAGEHEKQTLESLLITPLSSARIVLGKVIAVVCPVLFIQSIFLLVIVLALIGESIVLSTFVQVVLPAVAQCILLAMILALGAISIFCSSLSRKTITGVIAAYCACLLWLLPIPYFVRIQLWLLIVLVFLVVVTTWFPRLIADLPMQLASPTKTRVYSYRIKLVIVMITLFIEIAGLLFLFAPDSWDEISGILLGNPFVGVSSLFDTINFYGRHGRVESLQWLNSCLVPLAVIIQLLVAYVAFRLTVVRLDSLRNGSRNPAGRSVV